MARWLDGSMARWLDGGINGSIDVARWLDANGGCLQPRCLDARLDAGLDAKLDAGSMRGSMQARCLEGRGRGSVVRWHVGNCQLYTNYHSYTNAIGRVYSCLYIQVNVHQIGAHAVPVSSV